MKPVNVRVVSCLPLFLALVFASAASAQTPPAVSGFVTGNIGLALPAADSLTTVASISNGANLEELRVTTNMSASPLIDFGGGVLIRNRWMFGASLDRTSQTSPADITMTMQHPDFHPTLTATMASEPRKRVDSGLHLSAGINVPISSRFSMRIFGGPSRLTREQDVLDSIDPDEFVNPITRTYSLTIASPGFRQIRSSAWGYHVGADGSYFFSKYVGVGGQLRYSHATFETENVLQSMIDDRPVTDSATGGGLSLAGGIRIRF
jgi:hypothetical protein